MVNYFYLLFAVCLTLFSGQTNLYGQQATSNKDNTRSTNYLSIPVAGNSWATSPHNTEYELITESGLQKWSDPNVLIKTYFRIAQAGKIQLALKVHIISGSSSIKCQIGKETKVVNISNTTTGTLKIGTFNIKKPGYQTVVFTGISKTAGTYAEISDVLIAGDAVDSSTRYVKDDFYWGRRGPSVHLNYEIPSNAGDAAWFYNEITVHKENDVVGSYFMANGFGEGYFGIQVNSPTERRILFSVWSPYKTDKPGDIPEDQRIILLKKGENVTAGAFGNEGSGGQSYRKYFWKSGITYRFLLKGTPSENSSTDYTAWFFAPEIGKWEIIASFRRPKTTTYLKRLHSFLENFIPENGNIPRMGIYSNQWVCNPSGAWASLVKARFTADATARKEARLDYSGGSAEGRFYLKNCGFFNDNTAIDTWFTRSQTGEAPIIDFSVLP